MNDVTQDELATLDSSDGLEPDVCLEGTKRNAPPSADSSRSLEHLRSGAADRRKPSIKSFIYGAFNPRRRRIRRVEDRDQTFLDWHPKRLLTISAIVLILSLIDGLLTVYLVENGASEFSTFISFLGGDGPVLYALGKFLITAAIVIALVLTSHMRIYRTVTASTILYLFLSVYLAMLLWQFSLAWAII